MKTENNLQDVNEAVLACEDITEIRNLLSTCRDRIKTLQEAKKADNVQKLKDFAAQNGIKLKDVEFEKDEVEIMDHDGNVIIDKRRGKVAPRYRHKEDSSLVWSGRGKHPIWVVEHIKLGGSLEDLLI